MAALSSIALAVGTVASIGGTIMGASAQSKMAREQKEATTKAENAREAQMRLDADRRRRTAFREALLNRSMALSTGTAQNAAQGSGVAGGMAQATATGLQTQQTTSAAEYLGAQVFDANRAYASATAAGQSKMAWAGAMSGFGNVLMSNASTFGRLGTYYTQRNQTPQYG